MKQYLSSVHSHTLKVLITIEHINVASAEDAVWRTEHLQHKPLIGFQSN